MNNHEEEEEEECRVCRGPAEPDHPLFKPCRCSGSIGLCHQDCLVSWLEIKHSQKCELCHYNFQFEPQYQPNTPDHLPLSQVMLGCFNRLLQQVPVVLRILFCLGLWLFVAPLATSYLYHGWMARASSVRSRWNSFKVTDWIAGLLLIGVIVITFLSMMSFLDFLRLEWDRPPQRRPQREPVEPPVLDQVWEEEEEEEENEETSDDEYEAEHVEDDISWDELQDHVEESDDTESDLEDEDGQFDGMPPVVGINDIPPPPPLLDAEAEVVDINIALDELLGLRAPVANVVRNMLWLIAFNAGFLCFFAFFPRTIGVALSHSMFNTTLNANNTDFYWNQTDKISISNIMKAIEGESIRRNTAFRLHDVCVILLGYLFLAFIVVVAQQLRYLVKGAQSWGNRGERRRDNEVRAAMGEMNRLVQGINNDDDFVQVDLGTAVGGFLDCLIASCKVGMLLFVKMFSLPIVLGLALDISTTTLLGSTMENFIEYAGRDIFSFILFHWVAGITFMLLVTVSVLQLREVVHPDLLSQVIRPQEPHPDLLGNLLHDSVGAHAKRMALSLVIYAFLLALHVYVPVRLGVTASIAEQFGASFQLQFSYLLSPLLQVPLELLCFHLCMLALLERYKNGLGGMQHRWLKYMGKILGITDRLLPQQIRSFELVGSRKLFSKPHQVDKVWKDIAGRNKNLSALLESNLSLLDRPEYNRVTLGVVNDKGERQVSRADFIVLNGRPSEKRSMIPTQIGQYRLQREGYSRSEFRILVWKEVPGNPIPRPPEGWDDLGAGGADVQGRWAWNREKMSAIERSIATRKPFFPNGQATSESLVIAGKLVVMGVLSWIAASTILSLAVTLPLAIGRNLFSILLLPKEWIHDPFGYAVGFILAFPIVRKMSLFLTKSSVGFDRRLATWVRRFHRPSASKCLILAWALLGYFVLAPALLGLCYQMVVADPSTLGFEGQSAWLIGTALLYIWSQMCIAGVLTKQFRVYVFEGRQLEDNNEETWQGKRGYLGKFFEKLHKVKHWEWDQIDRVSFLGNVVHPILTHLLLLCSIPYSWYQLVGHFHLDRCYRIVDLRSAMCLVGLTELSLFYKQEIKGWMQAAHRVARDDRFLVGEVLLNHPRE